MSEIKCTGNSGNGCFMDSCGHDCGCEGLKEFGEKLLEKRKETVIENIVNYLNAEYKNATVKYENESFIIEGDDEDSQKMKESLEEMLIYSRKKN